MLRFFLCYTSHGSAAALMTMILQTRLLARAGTADARFTAGMCGEVALLGLLARAGTADARFTAGICGGAALLGSLLTGDMLGDLDHKDGAPELVLVVVHVHFASSCLCLYHVPGYVICPA